VSFPFFFLLKLLLKVDSVPFCICCIAATVLGVRRQQYKYRGRAAERATAPRAACRARLVAAPPPARAGKIRHRAGELRRPARGRGAAGLRRGVPPARSRSLRRRRVVELSPPVVEARCILAFPTSQPRASFWLAGAWLRGPMILIDIKTRVQERSQDPRPIFFYSSTSIYALVRSCVVLCDCGQYVLAFVRSLLF
jgi:hypothetical protein